MMDEMERRKKAVASLPPDYVSLAMLKERWLQKQKEKKLLEEEQKQRELEEDNLNEGALKSENDVPAVVGEIEPENAVEQIGGFGNGERKKKWRKRRFKKKKKQPLVDHEEKQNHPRVDGEMKRSNGYKKVEITRGNELTKVGTFHDERGRIFGKSVRGEDSKVKSDRVRGGFRRNATDRGSRRRREEYRVNDNEVVDGNGNGNGFVKRRRNRRNRRRGHKNKEYRGKLDNLKVNEAAGMSWGRKVGDEKEKVKNGTDRRRNGDNRKIEYSWKGRGSAIMQGFKGNEVEPKLAEDQVLEAGSKVDVLDGMYRNRLARQYHRVDRESLKDTTNSIAWDGVSALDRAINGKNWEARNGFRSDGSRSGNVGRKLGRLALNDLSAGNAISSMELNVGNNRRSGRSKVWKSKQNNWGMLWVKKEEKSSANAF